MADFFTSDQTFNGKAAAEKINVHPILDCLKTMKKIFSAFGRWELNSRNSQKVGSDSEPS